jgi:hypothetical protein
MAVVYGVVGRNKGLLNEDTNSGYLTRPLLNDAGLLMATGVLLCSSALRQKKLHALAYRAIEEHTFSFIYKTCIAER